MFLTEKAPSTEDTGSAATDMVLNIIPVEKSDGLKNKDIIRYKSIIKRPQKRLYGIGVFVILQDVIPQLIPQRTLISMAATPKKESGSESFDRMKEKISAVEKKTTIPIEIEGTRT